MNTTSFNQDLIDTIREYDLLQDRLPGDSLSLPNQWTDIKINPNDYILAETINYSLESLYKNWLYLLAYSVIPTNDIPDAKFVGDIIMDKSSSSDILGGVVWTTLDDEFANENSLLSDVQHLIKVQNGIEPNDYNIVAATTTNIMLLSGTGTNSINLIVNNDNLGRDPIYSNSSITHPSNGILFQEIKDMVITKDVDLFVLDSVHNTVFKFDITGIITLDEAVLKNDTPGRLLTEMVGGIGVLNDKIKFVNPVCLTTVDNNIFVVDYDTTSKICVVKKFDSHLNWISSYNLGSVDTQSIIHMSYSSLEDMFYILTNDTNNNTPPKVSKYTSMFDFVSQHDLMNFTKHDRDIANEQYKKIYFSLENNNIMYVVTDKNVYKKYASRPESFIGRFKLNERSVGPIESDRRINDITIFPKIVYNGSESMRKDEILLFEGHNRIIYKFLEDSGFENSFESSVDDKILTFDDIKIKPEENVDIIVYNKAFYKLLYNNFVLLENISRKFATYYDDKGISQYIGFRYLNSQELKLLMYDMSIDNYISSNELIVSDTINRCLRLILELQTTILSNMKEKSVNVYPDPNKTIILN